VEYIEEETSSDESPKKFKKKKKKKAPQVMESSEMGSVAPDLTKRKSSIQDITKTEESGPHIPK